MTFERAGRRPHGILPAPARTAGEGGFMRRFLVFLLGVAILLAGAAAWAVWNVRATLPRGDEDAPVDAAGTLAAGTTVAIDYDSRGVPTIHAQDELSLAFGQGWAHARDRRFQMELYRRSALGRLA